MPMPIAPPGVPADQDALYYPYIHVRDAAWLKATLLCFPHVYRMVPSGLNVSDDRDVEPFARALGTRGEPLLAQSPIDPTVGGVQADLARRIEHDVQIDADNFCARFSVEAASREYANGASEFQIHRNKFLPDLLSTLERYRLVWNPHNPNRVGDWWAVHPVLGEAVMSTIAVALAQRDGLHIVTSSEKKHRALTAYSTNEIYDALIYNRSEAHKPANPELTNRLAQLVIYSNFDVDQLTPEKIIEVSRETGAFRDLRAQLAEECAAIPEMTNQERIDSHLKDAAGRIIAEWQSQKPTTSRFIKDLFTLGLFDKTESTLKDAAKTALTAVFGGGAVAGVAHATGVAAAGAAGAASVLGAAPGLAVGVVYYAVATARKQWTRQADSQFRFLTKIERAGAVFTASPDLVKNQR
jgi:hypothetical protein